MDRVKRIKELEQEVARSTEVSLRLQKELVEANAKLANGTAPANQKKAPSLEATGVSLMP